MGEPPTEKANRHVLFELENMELGEKGFSEHGCF